MAAGDARPVPLKNIAYRAYFPILDADGDLVSGAASLDSERSLDGGTFADCTNEATEVATSSGIYFLDLTTTEMNTDCTVVIVKTATAGAKTTVLVLYPVDNGDIPINVTRWQNGTPNALVSGTRLDVSVGNVQSGAIDSAGIASNAIGASQLAANAITDTKIATGAFTAAKFAANAITGSVLADNAITAAKLATGAITAAKFAANAITSTVLANDAITAAKIAADAIGASELADGSITAAKFGTSAITSTVLANDAITAAKIATNALTAAKAAADLLTAIENEILDAARSAHTVAGSIAESFNAIENGQASGTPTTTTIETNLSTSLDNDHYKGRLLVFITGALTRQAKPIASYTASPNATFGIAAGDPFTSAPSAGDRFIIV